MRLHNFIKVVIIFTLLVFPACTLVAADEAALKLESRINNAVDTISRFGNVAEDPESLAYMTMDNARTLFETGKPSLTRIFKTINNKNENRIVRIMLIDLAAAISGPDSAATLLKLINDPDENSRVKAAAIEKWHLTGDSSAAEQILRFLDDKSEPVLKLAAMRAFTRIKNRESVIPLLSILEKGDYYQKACAARALGNQQDSRALLPLLSLTGSWAEKKGDSKENIAAAIQAVKAVGNISDTEAVSGLMKILTDANAPLELRCFAARSLGRQNSGPAYFALTETIQNEIPDTLKIYIARGIADTGRSDGAAACRKALEKVADPYTKQVFLETALKLERQ
jgi:HEAT repeat protein